MANLGFNYETFKISKHEDNDIEEDEEIFDYVKGEHMTRKYKEHDHNRQTGSNWGVGLGYFPKSRPALKEGSTSKVVAVRDTTSGNLSIGPSYRSKDVQPKQHEGGIKEFETMEELEKDPKNPKLLYKRTRTRKTTGKVGDHVSQKQFGFGIQW